jgi:hypothetical protein
MGGVGRWRGLSLSGVHGGRRPGPDPAGAPSIISLFMLGLGPMLGILRSLFELIMVARKEGIWLLLVVVA